MLLSSPSNCSYGYCGHSQAVCFGCPRIVKAAVEMPPVPIISRQVFLHKGIVMYLRNAANELGLSEHA